jgi:hypothetical protein
MVHDSDKTLITKLIIHKLFGKLCEPDNGAGFIPDQTHLHSLHFHLNQCPLKKINETASHFIISKILVLRTRI